MSLINQMLRDLDSRPESGQGGTVRAVGRRRRTRLWFAGGLVVVFAVGVAAAIVLGVPGPMQGAPDDQGDAVSSPVASAGGEPEPAIEEPVRLESVEQVNTREGQQLRLAFSGDSDYRRRAAESDRLVIETPAEPLPELDQTLPPAVAAIERVAEADQAARLVVTLDGWRAGPLVADESRDGGDRLVLALEPVPLPATESASIPSRDEAAGDGSTDDGEASAPAESQAAEDGSPPTDTAEPETEPADQPDTASGETAETETVSAPANAEQPGESTMSRQRREPTPSELAEEHWSAAREALQAGREREAESTMRRILSLLPGHVPARTALTELFIEQGRLGDADQLLAEAGTAEGLAPGDRGYFLRQRARLWMNADEFGRAIELLEAADPDPAGEPETASLLAGLYYRAGRHQSAVDWYEALLETPPRRSAWWMGLGLARESVGEYSAAVTAYRRALEGDGLRPSVRDYLSERIRELDGRN